MADQYEVSITLQAVDLASEDIRQARAELDRLLATADAVRAGGLPEMAGLGGAAAPDSAIGGIGELLALAEGSSQLLAQHRAKPPPAALTSKPASPAR